MALAIAEPTSTTPAVPTCCGQPMAAVTAYVTQRVFHRCGTCHGNTYGLTASYHLPKD